MNSLNIKKTILLWNLNNQVLVVDNYDVELAPRRDIEGRYSYLNEKVTPKMEIRPIFQRYEHTWIVSAKRTNEDDERENQI